MNRQILLLCVMLFGFVSGIANPSHAADPETWIFQTRVAVDDQTLNYAEVFASAWNNDAEEARIFEFLKKQVQEDLKANPKLTISLTWITDAGSQKGRKPQSVLGDLKKLLALDSQPVPIPVRDVKLPAKEVNPALKEKLKKWFRSNYRLSFTAVRGIANGVIQSWSLMVMNQPPEIAVAAGIFVAGLCAGVTWNLSKLSEFTDHSKISDKIFKDQTGKLMGLLKSGSSFVERMGKWFLTEHIFVNLIKGAYLLLGIDPSIGFLTMQEEIAVAALLSTLSQGIYEIGVFRERARLLEKGVDKDTVEIRNQSFAMVGSILSVAGAIATTRGVELGPYLLGSLAALGVVNWIRIDRKTIAEKAKKLYHDCSIWLRSLKTSSRISSDPEWGWGTS
ncbi:MAG: hypothetical protein JNL01_08230 [Bdellovibrionales bacterium]|nr:hypothetical protein [Bdellovibrionales bacterium]